MWQQVLFKRVDNTPLVVFRILFGLLISFECYGAILTGWVKRTLIEPAFTFTFIGFEWLQPLPGNGMYFYFLVMGTLGLCISLGYRYRWSMVLFTLMWTGAYLMQKTSYNNHYYLLILVSFLMCFMPAARYASLDSRKNPSIRGIDMPAWVKWVVISQLFIVYTFAAIAKIYGDWLDFSIIAILLKGKASYPLIGDWLQNPWVHSIIGVMGIVFDLFIVPALLWKPTRKWAFGFSIFFHLFNSVIFQIGIFPYLSLAFTVFFFPPETIRRIFLPGKTPYSGHEVRIPTYKSALFIGFIIYFALQVALPLRHYFIKDDVLWTEEGHRMSWRMMLRTRAGTVQFVVENKKTGEKNMVPPGMYLSSKQLEKVSCYPDYIWQFAQFLKKEYAAEGKDVSVYARARVSINGRRLEPFTDPTVDLAAEKWDPFRHHSWILPSPLKSD